MGHLIPARRTHMAWQNCLFICTVAVLIIAAAHGVQADPPNPCPVNVANCVPQTTGTLTIEGYHTRHFDVICPADRPYYQGKWSKEIDSLWVGVSEWGWTKLTAHDRDAFSVTNWVSASHTYNVSVACASSPQTGVCVKDPGCPQDSDSRQEEGENYSRWSAWNETCADGTTCSCTTATLLVCCNCSKK